VVDADLESYFDMIPHERLMQRVEERISDGPSLVCCAAGSVRKFCGEWNGEKRPRAPRKAP